MQDHLRRLIAACAEHEREIEQRKSNIATRLSAWNTRIAEMRKLDEHAHHLRHAIEVATEQLQEKQLPEFEDQRQIAQVNRETVKDVRLKLELNKTKTDEAEAELAKLEQKVDAVEHRRKQHQQQTAPIRWLTLVCAVFVTVLAVLAWHVR